MKKLIMLLMAFCLISPMANAELTKKQEKNISKMAKNRAKQLEKEGYTAMGSLPLYSALEKHYTALENGALEQIGNGHSKSKNNGRQMCLTYAIAEYASKEVSQLKGRSVTDGYGNEVDTANDPEFARFYAAYERLTQKEIKGELKESFSVCKQLPDGSYEIVMYLTIDESKANDRRQKALDGAIKESGLAKEYAKQVSSFINEK